MRKWLGALLVVFIVCFFYLHQKVKIHEQAYLLTDNYKHYSDLIEERDFLLYEFSRKISLDRINRWAQHNEFDIANGEIVLAFENGKVETSDKEKVLEANIFARFSRRLFNLPEGPEALAEDTE